MESFNNIANDLDSFYATNSEYLKQHIVDDELMCKSNEEASNLIKIAELDIQKLKDVFFDGKILIFGKNKDQIYKSILGIKRNWINITANKQKIYLNYAKMESNLKSKSRWFWSSEFSFQMWW